MSSAGIIAHRLHPSTPVYGPVLFTHGSGVVQKFDIEGVDVTEDNSVGITHRNSRSHLSTGRVFIPQTNGVSVYESGAVTDPIAAPTFISFTQTMLQTSPYQSAIDQDTGTFAIVGGNTDKVLLIFDDNSTQEIIFGNVDPHMICSIGSGKFAVWCLGDGMVYVYGPSNDYATPLVTSGSAVWIVLAMTADVAGGRVFLSSDDSDDIKNMDVSTGTISAISTGDRSGYRLCYNADLDYLVMDNQDDVADRGKVFVISPDTGIVTTIDLSTYYSPDTIHSSGMLDMALLDDKVVCMATFVKPDTSEYVGVIMADITTGLPVTDIAYAVGEAPQSFSVNTRDSKIYIGASNMDSLVVMTPTDPYFDFNIEFFANTDNRWVTWL